MQEIRRARADEAEKITECMALAFEAFRPQYTSGAFHDTVASPEALRKRMEHMTVYVAVAPDGTVIGTLAAAVMEKEGHLRGVAVRPDWQGHRIAEQLLARAESDLLVAGCTHITLDVTMPLQRAVRFYEKTGFVATGKTGDFFGMPLREFAKPLIAPKSDEERS
jgi:ribosomal protein S18 acetylase RimI-like enzyme